MPCSQKNSVWQHIHKHTHTHTNCGYSCVIRVDYAKALLQAPSSMIVPVKGHTQSVQAQLWYAHTHLEACMCYRCFTVYCIPLAKWYQVWSTCAAYKSKHTHNNRHHKNHTQDHNHAWFHFWMCLSKGCRLNLQPEDLQMYACVICHQRLKIRFCFSKWVLPFAVFHLRPVVRYSLLIHHHPWLPPKITQDCSTFHHAWKREESLRGLQNVEKSTKWSFTNSACLPG